MNFNTKDNSKRFNFVTNSRYFFIFSIVITIIGVLTLSILGLNYGVDFKSGSNVDIMVSKDLTGSRPEIESFLSDNGFGSPATTISADRLTLRFDNVLSDADEHKLKDAFSAKFDQKASMEVNTVDVEIARELQFNALKAILVASIGIIIYVSIRFEWRFAVAAIIALLHDAFIVISLFSILRLEVNLPFIVAILTIIGYSINDTIVIFDRIRENMRFAKVKTVADLARIVNDSVWQTLSRSINTVLTVIVTSICLFFFGSESIKLFALAITFGLFSGAYSSIFIASPLWLLLKKGQKPKRAVKTSAAS